ncbi:MAG TPA: hypothetical protein VNU23_08420 [Candidatus Cybelea sp.]|jgi:hypothetical protein|nr:hypothetical protein [Candidatus Cybelea sp.]
MKAILCGATGMVGQGLLRECLLDPAVEHGSRVCANHLRILNRKYHWVPRSHLLA